MNMVLKSSKNFGVEMLNLRCVTLILVRNTRSYWKLICRNEERRLQATMTDEQKERFSHYTDAVREYQMTTGSLIFQKGFKLSAWIMMEVMEEQE